MSNAELGQRIRIIRLSQQMTQSELGAQVGYSAVMIGAIERGHAKLRLEKLVLICRVLNVTVEDIAADDWRKRCQRGGISLEEPRA